MKLRQREYMKESADRATRDAFERDFLPRVLWPMLSKVQKEIREIVEDLDDEKWPNRNVEQLCVRYKPQKMTMEKFCNEMADLTIEWSRRFQEK